MKAYASEIWRLRYFWMALVRIDLRRNYRNSVLGLGWSLAMPLAMAVILCTVFVNLFNANIRTFAPYLLAGLTVWNFVHTSICNGCQAFLQGEPYIRQQPAPLAIYSLRTTLTASIHLLIGTVIVALLGWSLRSWDSESWSAAVVDSLTTLPLLLSLAPTLALLFALAWSLATCMAVINVLFQDAQHLAQVAMQAVFYLTPIMYPPNMLRGQRWHWVITCNPLSSYMELFRAPIVDARLPALSTYAVAAATTLAVATGASLLLLKFERRMIFYL